MGVRHVQGRARRLILVGSVLGVAIQFARYYATLPFLGWLVTRPLRYELIRPSELAIVVGGAYARDGRDPAWAVLLLGLVGLAYADPLRWLAGAAYGEQVLVRCGVRRDVVARVERFAARWGAWALVLGWYTPVPVWLIQLVTGTSGMSFRKFLLADLGGTFLYVAVMFTLGYSIGHPAVNAVNDVSRYATDVFWVAGPVIVVVLVVRWLRRRSQADVAA